MKNNLNRRSFFRRGAALGAGIALGTRAHARPEELSAAPPDKIELAIATICLDGFGDHNFEPSFSLIPQTGIKNVEFNVWYPRNVSPRGLAGIQERCYRHGLRPISLQGTAFGGHILKDVTHKLWLMEQARTLGCRRIKFTGSARGSEGGLEAVIEVLREIAPAAEEMDVIVAVENHANNTIENLQDYRQIFDTVHSSHIGMCLDMGHFDGAGVDNFEVVREFHDKVVHVDLKDCHEVGTYKTVPYGQGITDGEGIVKALIGKGYSGYLVIEQAPPREGLDLVAEMKRVAAVFAPYTS